MRRSQFVPAKCSKSTTRRCSLLSTRRWPTRDTWIGATTRQDSTRLSSACYGPVSCRDQNEHHRHQEHERGIEKELRCAMGVNKAAVQIRKYGHKKMAACNCHEPKTHDDAFH